MADSARDRGLSRLYLWVTDTNRAAGTLYERCGFKATGDWQPLPSDPARCEIEMMLPL
jgi:RimJ/RimL family protein N-acetyltransferase